MEPHIQTARFLETRTPIERDAVFSVLNILTRMVTPSLTSRVLEFQRESNKTVANPEQGCPETGIIDETTLAAIVFAHSEARNPKRPMKLDFESMAQTHSAEIFGVDVSANRPGLNLALLKERAPNCKVLYVKATEGGKFTDPTASKYIEEGSRLGFGVGAYAWPWSHFNGAEADREAPIKNFATLWNRHREQLILPPMLDIEAATPEPANKLSNKGWGNVSLAVAYLGREKAFALFCEWLDRADQALGIECGIYTSNHSLRAFKWAWVEKAGWLKRPLWLAYYETPAPRAPRLYPPRWRPNQWAMWQFSSKTRAPGYAKGLDGNYINQNAATGGVIYQALRRARLLEAAPPAPPTAEQLALSAQAGPPAELIDLGTHKIDGEVAPGGAADVADDMQA